MHITWKPKLLPNLLISQYGKQCALCIKFAQTIIPLNHYLNCSVSEGVSTQSSDRGKLWKELPWKKEEIKVSKITTSIYLPPGRPTVQIQMLLVQKLVTTGRTMGGGNTCTVYVLPTVILSSSHNPCGIFLKCSNPTIYICSRNGISKSYLYVNKCIVKQEEQVGGEAAGCVKGQRASLTGLNQASLRNSQRLLKKNLIK